MAPPPACWLSAWQGAGVFHFSGHADEEDGPWGTRLVLGEGESITLEDILEEIVGEITDEFDIDEEHPLRRTNAGDVIVDGHLHQIGLRELRRAHREQEDQDQAVDAKDKQPTGHNDQLQGQCQQQPQGGELVVPLELHVGDLESRLAHCRKHPWKGLELSAPTPRGGPR